jgi:5-methylcytosine-specific restriction endonuclease McrA
MMKIDRNKIRNMFDGRCAYCGKPLDDNFHIDHVKPIYRGREGYPLSSRQGEDIIENMMPSCPRCNLWKKTFTVEEFRQEISAQAERVRRDCAGYRLAEDFNLVHTTGHDVSFWFERHKPK